MTALPRQPVDLRRHATDIASAASRAPSHHNAQPWAFRLGVDKVEVFADRSRRMPVADPADRQLLLGVGASVYGVRLALGHLGLPSVVRLARDPGQPDLAAVVTVLPGRIGPTDAADAARQYAEVNRRRTVRGMFTDDAVPVSVQVALTDVVRRDGVALHWVVRRGYRRDLAAMTAAAEREQQADPEFRAELARWVGPAAAGGGGIPYANLGTATADEGDGPGFQLRDFTGGDPVAAEIQAHRPEAHPGIAILYTHTDQRADWLRAGQALFRLLLEASAAGYQASYLNQPLEVPRMRTQIRADLGLQGLPQVILRLGQPAGALPPPTPRRPAPDVLQP
jgi:nitroreductase